MVACAGATSVVGFSAISGKVRAFKRLALHASDGLREEFAGGTSWAKDNQAFFDC